MSQTKTWYKLNVVPKENETSTATLEIFDEIGLWGIDATAFKRDLDTVKDLPLNIQINSPGGNVFDGLAIYNMIKQHKGETTIEVMGLAASIASIIAMGGDKLVMRDGSFLMIHNPFSMMIGDAEEMRKEAEVLDQIKQELVNIYVEKSSLSEDEVKTMMDEETWMNAAQCMEYGFCDEVEEAALIAANFNKSLDKYGFKDNPIKKVIEKKKAALEKEKEQLKEQHKKDLNEIDIRLKFLKINE